jgi:tetratricopeptide (TPR) repeat protein
MKFTKKQIRQILSEATTPAEAKALAQVRARMQEALGGIGPAATSSPPPAPSKIPSWIKGIVKQVWSALDGWVDNDDLKEVIRHMKGLKTRKNWKLFVSYYKQVYKKRPGDVIKGVSTNSVKRSYKRAAFELAAGRGYTKTPTPAVTQPAPSPGTGENAEEVAEKASRAFKAGKFVTAANRFLEAYRISKKPTALYNAARSYQKGGMIEAARHYFNEYIKHPRVGTKGKEEAKAHLAKLGSPVPAPGASSKRARRRRRRSGRGSYAKGPKVRQIQQLLLKAFGAGFVQEAKELNEVDDSATVKPLQGGALSAKEVLGGKGRVDSMLGKTTLKSINKIPYVVNTFSQIGGITPKNVKKYVPNILAILKKCSAGRFKDPLCKPGGKASAAASEQPTAAPGAMKCKAECVKTYTRPTDKTDCVKRCDDRRGPAAPTAAAPKPSPGASEDEKAQRKKGIKGRIASASSVKEIKSICKELGTYYIGKGSLNRSTGKKNPYGACKGYAVKPGAFKESKSPLKQKEIKHFGVRRNKLLETLIKKVSK